MLVHLILSMSGMFTFALQAIEAAKLDRVYFMPERQPRHKRGVEHFGHRVAMLERALRPHRKCQIIETVDVNFNVLRTLPRLQRQFAGDQLVFLFGSDVLPTLSDWSNSQQLLQVSELVIGLRQQAKQAESEAIVATWPVQPPAVTMFESFAPLVSSGEVREALYRRKTAKGLLKSVERYSDRNWLYVSLT